MKAVFDHVQQEASNIFSFWFRPSQPLHYNAGQFTELSLPHDNPDDRGMKRYFTLSSSPTDELVSITTKFAAEHGSSFKTALKNLVPGTTVTLAEPLGDFILPKDSNIPLVFVAEGIGVTPFHSIIKYLLDTGEQRDSTLIYAVNQLEAAVFSSLFTAYPPLRLVLIPKQPPMDWQGESGSLTAEKILQLIGDASGKLIYLAGPEPMIEQFDTELRTRGIQKEQLVTDFFPGYNKS